MLSELDRVEECRGRDQVGDHVEDLEPPLDVGRVASGAGIGDALEKRQRPLHERQGEEGAPGAAALELSVRSNGRIGISRAARISPYSRKGVSA